MSDRPEQPDSVSAGPSRLTVSDAEDWHPAYSYDGQRIAFDSDRSGQREIWIVNSDGTEPAQVTRDVRKDWLPAWSPDGQLLVFNRQIDESPNNALYTIRVDGSDETKVFEVHEKNAMFPSFSPDGKKIIFCLSSKTPKSFCQLYSIDLNGDNLTRIDVGLDGYHLGRADWSRDGSSIVFSAEDPKGSGGVWRVGNDGAGLLQLHEGKSFWPVWSPDGTKIVFMSYRFDNWSIWVMKADGSGLRQITSHPGTDGGLSYDGSRIVFESCRSGTADNWVVHDIWDDPPQVIGFQVVRTCPIQIKIFFGKEMDGSTLTASVIEVEGNETGVHSGKVVYDGETSVATFTPDSPFSNQETIAVTVSGAIQDSMGLSLDGDGDGISNGRPTDDYSWSFQMGSIRADG